MEKNDTLSPAKLEVLEFDDEQLAKVGAALQALVEQMPTTKQNIKEDIIDLLSDSDCEGEDSQKSALQALHDKAFKSNIPGNVSKSTEHQMSNSFTVDEVKPALTSLYFNQKFMFPKCEPLQSKLNNNENTLHLLDKNQRNSAGTYITLTDITGEEIEVKEVNVSEMLGTTEKLLMSPKPTTQMQQNLSLQSLIESQINKEKALIEANSALQTQHVKSYYKGENDFPEPASPNENFPSEISWMDSNGNCADFDVDVVDIDDMSDNGAELSDHSSKQILIDLVDSDTEDEQETGELPREGGPFGYFKRSSIDCFVMYSCPECSLLCGSAVDWKLHTDTEHKYSTVGALNMQTIIDKTGHICYQCRDCPQKFELQTPFHRLLPHRISHLPNENYLRCRVCDSSFRNKGCVRRHLLKMHYKICSDFLQKGKRPNIYAMKYIKISCPICSQQLGSRKQWHEHLEKTHDFSKTCMSQVSPASNDVYVCSLCDVKIRKRSIMEHMLTHEKIKSFACTYCNKYEASGIMIALAHVRRAHLMPEKESIFKCNYCDEVFQKLSARTNHMRNKHKVKRPKCDICEKEFYSISLLLSHMNFANHHKLK